LAVTPQRVAAALSLAQHHLNHGDAASAISLLEDPRVGPKTLADKQHAAIATRAMLQRTYTLAILSYVAAIPKADDTDATVAKALAALDSLKEQLGDDPAGQRRLSAIYVSLARNLQKQIDEATPAAKKTVSAAFQQFLDRAAETSTDISVLNWIADSYVGLGRGFTDELGRISDDGQAFFGRAVSIYDSILERASSGQLPLPDADVLRTQSRLAIAYREMGEYAQAIDVLARVLQRQETQVYIQLEAARTFHQWGDRSDANAYVKAIRGDRQKTGTNKNLIWGYGRIANIVARSPKLRSLFHEARYGVAQCRYQYALRQPKAQRAKELAQAEQDILVTARLYGLGDDETKSQYEELLGQIQRAQGKPARGIK
jgi:tetratricopeptide (TPR) repeat protein